MASVSVVGGISTSNSTAMFFPSTLTAVGEVERNVHCPHGGAGAACETLDGEGLRPPHRLGRHLELRRLQTAPGLSTSSCTLEGVRRRVSTPGRASSTPHRGKYVPDGSGSQRAAFPKFCASYCVVACRSVKRKGEFQDSGGGGRVQRNSWTPRMKQPKEHKH